LSSVFLLAFYLLLFLSLSVLPSSNSSVFLLFLFLSFFHCLYFSFSSFSLFFFLLFFRFPSFSCFIFLTFSLSFLFLPFYISSYFLFSPLIFLFQSFFISCILVPFLIFLFSLFHTSLILVFFCSSLFSLSLSLSVTSGGHPGRAHRNVRPLIQLSADCTPCHTWYCQLPVNPWALTFLCCSLLSLVFQLLLAWVPQNAWGIPRACAKRPSKSNFFTMPTLTPTNLLTHCPTHPVTQGLSWAVGSQLDDQENPRFHEIREDLNCFTNAFYFPGHNPVYFVQS
jgi:hypothetical protein